MITPSNSPGTKVIRIPLTSSHLPRGGAAGALCAILLRPGRGPGLLASGRRAIIAAEGGVSMADGKYFPSTKFEALAMLYVQSQDLREKTPAEILNMYNTAYAEIKKESAAQNPIY